MSNKTINLPDTYSYELNEKTSDRLSADYGKPVPVFVRIYNKELSLLRFVYGMSRNDLEIIRYALSQSEQSGIIKAQELSQIAERMPVLYSRLHKRLGVDKFRTMKHEGLPVDFVFEAVRDEFKKHDTPRVWKAYEGSLMLAGDNLRKASSELDQSIRSAPILKPIFDFLDRHPLVALILLICIFLIVVGNHVAHS